MIDPLTQTPNLKPVEAKPAEWDANFSEDLEVEPDAPEVEEETEAAPEQPEEEEPQATEDEEAPEVTEPTEESESEELQAQEEKPSRAQKRIQQLVQRNKEKDNQLAEAMQRLAELQQRQFDQQQQAFQRVQQEQMARAQQAQRMQALQDAGFDPTNPAHQFLIQYDEEMRAMRAQIEKYESQNQQLQAQAQWNSYHQKLDRALEGALKTYEVEADDLNDLRELALAKAVKDDLADPSVAVAAVVKPFLKLLPKKTPKAAAPKKEVAPEVKQAQAAMSLKGSAGLRKAGDKPAKKSSQTSRTSDPSDILDEMYGGKKQWG